MAILDDLVAIREADHFLVLKSIELLPKQIAQAWKEASRLKIPPHFRKVSNIVVAGMGGSALGARVIDAVDFEILNLPLEIVSDYYLPGYVSQDSLVIVSSYSGMTEEAIACFHQALRKGACLLAITTGGQLANLASRNNLPAYIFNPQHNPSDQPRFGLGYSLTAELAILAKEKFIRLFERQIQGVIDYLEGRRSWLVPGKPTSQNQAKKTALLLKDQIIVLVAAEHLAGAAYAFRNILNETAKNFATCFSLPAMNHHLLEGLSYPEINKKSLRFLFIDSDLYHPEIKKRAKLTQTVAEENGLRWEWLKIEGKTKLIQAFETIYLAGFISFYLALLNEVNPGKIPWVEFFKTQLKKNHQSAYEKKR